MRVNSEIRILVVNTGATSTKIAVFHGENQLFSGNLRLDEGDLSRFPDVYAQKDFRLSQVQDCLRAKNLSARDFSAAAAIGGLLKPLASGTYRVNEKMLDDLSKGICGSHASNLGAIIAHEMVNPFGLPVFVTDPVSVDELSETARLSGHAEIDRVCLSHALNTKAAAKRFAAETNRSYTDLRLIVIHFGTGISVSAHEKGRMIDVNNSMEEGPMGMDRAGGVPVMQLLKLAFSGKYSPDLIKRMLFGEGGVYSYLNTRDLNEVMKMIDLGDERARAICDSMVYQAAKEAGAMAAVLRGKVDAVILTGGMTNEERVTASIAGYVSFIAPVVIYKGEDEMRALAEGALRVLLGEEDALEYK
ncbi:MAG: butyrate kinase [Deltaproteobacteria bacterium]|nr:butyrate kinase [Deltaproteobacteria bacterium]